MTTVIERARPELTVRLSQEEVTTLLAVTQVESLPGIPENTDGGLTTPEGAGLQLLHGERSLRTRGMAALGQQGELLVDESLLGMFGTCVAARQALWVFHTGPEQLTTQTFGFIGDGAATVYTVPEPGIYEFSLLDSPDLLVPISLGFAGCAELAPAGGQPVEVAADDLAGIARGEEPAQDVPPQLASLLKGPHVICDLIHLTRRGEDFDRQTLTIVHNESTGWIMRALTEDRFLFESTGAAELRDIVDSWLKRAV